MKSFLKVLIGYGGIVPGVEKRHGIKIQIASESTPMGQSWMFG
jgi:hypothetical protein